MTPNHALQRTAAGSRGCDRRVSWPISPSLGRQAARRQTAFITLLALAGLSSCGRDVPMNSEDIQWPSLADYPCTVGRAATSDDVSAGRAVFVLQADGQPIGRPLSIRIPQYAFHVDEETKQRSPCVIIQSEEARGQQLIGCRTLPDGQIMAGFFDEFEFLGDKP